MDPVSHVHQAPPVGHPGGVEPGTVVADRHLEHLRTVPDLDLDVPRAGVLDGVREGLADQEVGPGLHLGVHAWQGVGLQLHLDRQP